MLLTAQKTTVNGGSNEAAGRPRPPQRVSNVPQCNAATILNTFGARFISVLVYYEYYVIDSSSSHLGSQWTRPLRTGERGRVRKSPCGSMLETELVRRSTSTSSLNFSGSIRSHSSTKGQQWRTEPQRGAFPGLKFIREETSGCLATVIII